MIGVTFDVRCVAVDHHEYPRRYRWHGKGPMPSRDAQAALEVAVDAFKAALREQGFEVARTGYGVLAHEYAQITPDDTPAAARQDARDREFA